mmetsp:Transcript_8766/g.25247  ORF Transcript_8766/g.25247 Transcript_8766/m.25247 type:complete len:140 (+) Transcript_8766:197-616(+)
MPSATSCNYNCETQSWVRHSLEVSPYEVLLLGSVRRTHTLQRLPELRDNVPSSRAMGHLGLTLSLQNPSTRLGDYILFVQDHSLAPRNIRYLVHGLGEEPLHDASQAAGPSALLARFSGNGVESLRSNLKICIIHAQQP